MMPDIEWFVKRESERARAKGKKLFLHGFSMVRHASSLLCQLRVPYTYVCDGADASGRSTSSGIRDSSDCPTIKRDGRSALRCDIRRTVD